MWDKDKSQLSRTRLHRQIAQCNTIINRDKVEYYCSVINHNSHNPKKVWQVLDKGSEMILSPHQSDKSLANQFASFFTQKSKGSTIYLQHLPQLLYHPWIHLNLSHFNQVSENKILKIVKYSPTKLCLLDLVPTFLLKDCVDILVR